MKKIIVVTVAALTLLLAISGIALGNAFTLQAENGRILAPAGLGLELSGAYNKNVAGQSGTPLCNALISYGITPSITIAGGLTGDFKNNSNNQTVVKALFSPTREGNGYTLYADYNLNQSKIPCYGIALWTNLNFLYAYANLEARNATPSQPATLAVTPGVNLKIGSKIGINGEAEFKTADWSGQELRVGVDYFLNSKVAAKFTFTTGLADNPERIYTTGLAIGL